MMEKMLAIANRITERADDYNKKAMETLGQEEQKLQIEIFSEPQFFMMSLVA